MILDEFTYEHLLNWCRKQSHEPYDLATLMVGWLETLDEADREQAMNNGWPYVRSQAVADQ